MLYNFFSPKRDIKTILKLIQFQILLFHLLIKQTTKWFVSILFGAIKRQQKISSNTSADQRSFQAF